MPISRNLAYRGMTFMPLDGAAPLLEELDLNIADINKTLFPLLSS